MSRFNTTSSPVLPALALLGGLWSGAVVAAPTAQDEAIYQQYLDFHRLVSGGRVTPGWLPDGNTFWYAEGGPNDRQIIKVDPASDTAGPLFDVARLRTALTESLGYEPAGDGVPFAQLAPAGANAVAFSVDGESYVLDLETYTLTRKQPPGAFGVKIVVSEAERGRVGTYMREKFLGLGPMPSPEAMSPDGSLVATIDDYNLAIRATIDGQQQTITDDGTDASFWDVEAALWSPWSPNSQFLAVIRQHAEGLPKVPTIQWLKPLEQVMEVYTIPAGSKLYRSELYLMDRYSMQPVAVDLGDTQDQFVRILSWTPDSTELILALYNRVLNKVEIQAVNPLNGKVRSLMTEESKTFLTNHHEAIWATETGFTLLPDGSGFVWNSERTGWDHLYLYGLDGKLQRQLTSGEWPVKDVLRIDQQDGWVYFTCHSDQKRPYDTHLCRVGLDGKGFAQLTEGEGQHAPNISPSADYFVDTFSSVDIPPETVLRKADGTLLRALGKADISRAVAVGWVPPKEYVVKAADGKTDLWITAYSPYDFDPSKQYPLVEYIYAGPQTTMRPMDFGDQASLLYRGGNFNRALANLGFIVVSLDARGTPERSKAFHDAVYMNWGQFEIDDHATAIRQLAEQTGFIDLDRVGIWGASWGGHFTVRALAQAPDLYKVGISNVPGYDSRAFILYETYLGMPQENKAGYDAADALNLAPLIKGEIMLTGGLNDTATQKDVFRMSELLIKLGKQHHQFSFPNTGHGAFGVTGEYDMEMKKNYFIEMLNP